MKINKRICTSLLIVAMGIMSAGCSSNKVQEPINTSAPEAVKPVEENTTESAGEKDEVVVTETLPIGSVVTVEGSDEKYIIIAHEYILEEMPDLTWQYAAYLYPEGNISAKPAMAFNNEDIKSVLFEGLQTTEGVNLAEYEVKEGYLPLGTVVRVEGLETPLMIFGRSQQLSGTEDIYAYAACEYPTGNINPEETYLLNNAHISDIYFLGYSDEEDIAFKEKLPSVN